MSKPYKVITVHPFMDCNLKCSFCYQKDKPQGNLSMKEWFSIGDSIAKLTDQVAIGGGEPLLHPKFVKSFSNVLLLQNITCNLTTNGHLIKDVPQNTFMFITLVSISMDQEKIKCMADVDRIKENVRYLRENGNMRGNLQIGCNLLLDDFIVSHLSGFVGNLLMYFDRVFLLYPKNMEGPDVLAHKAQFFALDALYSGRVFVDDCINKIFEEESYNNWKQPCHYASDSVSIDSFGNVRGCSYERFEKVGAYDREKKVLVIEPSQPRCKCPFIKKEGA